MERKHILGMICGYYLSRFDRDAYAHLGYGTMQATHEALGRALDVPLKSIQNWRDEFDPVHGARVGWNKREMYPSRRRVLEALGEMSEPGLRALLLKAVSEPSGTEASVLVEAVEVVDEADSDQGFALRGPTGKLAEEAFQKHHSHSGEPAPGELIDRRHDQCGFDFEIKDGTGSLFVEVKGLAGQAGGITFTDKEWETAREYGDRYFLALVRDAAKEPVVSIHRNPAGSFEAKMRAYTVVQTCWSVSESLLRKAEKRPSV